MIGSIDRIGKIVRIDRIGSIGRIEKDLQDSRD